MVCWPDIYRYGAKRGKRLMDGIDKVLTKANIPRALMGPPQMFGFVLGIDKAPTNYRDALDTNMKLYEHIMTANFTPNTCL